jgi:hypothetical protein
MSPDIMTYIPVKVQIYNAALPCHPALRVHIAPSARAARHTMHTSMVFDKEMS